MAVLNVAEIRFAQPLDDPASIVYILPTTGGGRFASFVKPKYIPHPVSHACGQIRHVVIQPGVLFE
jgi:hypothetical protein